MKKNRSSKGFKFFVPLVLAGIIFAAVAAGLKDFLLHSPLFSIKTVIATGALKNRINPEELKLKGQNLFAVDIERLARQIRLEYPFLYQVRASRILADKIWLDAKERFPVARVRLSGREFLCDAEAVIMPFNDRFVALPLVTGIDTAGQAVRVGEVYDSARLKLALAILKKIHSSPQLRNLVIEKIETEVPQKVTVLLNTTTAIIFGNEGLDNRIQVLGVLLENLDTELAKVKYIDLRFNEPAIGKR